MPQIKLTKKIIIISVITLVFIVGLVYLYFLSVKIPKHSSAQVITKIEPSPQIPSPTPVPIPVNEKNIPAPLLSANAVYIVDMPTNKVIYEKNSVMKLSPASTTKIMTAIIALEDYKLTDVIHIKTLIKEGKIMNLLLNENMTVENLLYGILIHSANDAAFVLADHHDGGVEGFVARMNQKAQDLNLTQTHFTNSIGLDDTNLFTSARDLANLSLYALKNPIISKMVAIPQITVSDTTYTYFHPLKNVNELLGKIPGVAGLKTGYTENAGQALVTTIYRDGHQVLFVILKSEDRFGETEKLLNWVFENFSWK